MLDPVLLATLASIHRRGSFELAAAELHVTPSAVSQRLKALEEVTGALLIRRGQPCRATRAGERLIRHFDEIMLLEQRLAEEMPALAPGPHSLRVAVNADSLATWVLPALAEVPGFLFDLVIDDQDYSQEWLRKGEVVAAITSHPGPLPGCETKPLGALRYRATASPDFMTRWFAGGVTATTLAEAPGLSFSDKDRLQDRWVEQVTGRRIAFPCHRIASSQGFVDACRLGLGWGMNPEGLIAAALASGALAELLPQRPLDVALYWQFTRLAAPALSGLTRALEQHARRALVPLT